MAGFKICELDTATLNIVVHPSAVIEVPGPNGERIPEIAQRATSAIRIPFRGNRRRGTNCSLPSLEVQHNAVADAQLLDSAIIIQQRCEIGYAGIELHVIKYGPSL